MRLPGGVLAMAAGGWAALRTPVCHPGQALLAGLAALLLLALLLTWLLSRARIRNLERFTRQLEEAAGRPPGQRHITLPARDETRMLAEAFNRLMTRLDQKAALIHRAHAQAEEEMGLAKHVLKRLVEPGRGRLPRSFQMETLHTQRINGDACVYHRGPTGLHFGFLCDAAGHGLTAGISTLPAIQSFLDLAAHDVPLETMYQTINQRIHQLMPVNRFLCLMLIRLDLRSGALSVLNAGLPDAILCLPGAGRRRFPSRNLPAGIQVAMEPPESETVAAPPGSRLLAFTDGVLDLFPGTEAESRLLEGLERSPFGVHRAAVEETLALAIQDREQHDDVSWALWEIPDPADLPLPDLPPPPAGPAPADLDTPLDLALTFEPERLATRDLVPEVMRLLATLALPAALEPALALALGEALGNAVDHGLLRLDPALKRMGLEAYEALRRLHLAALQTGSVRLDIRLRTLPSGPLQEVVVEVEDSGPGFDWRAWELRQSRGEVPPGRGLRTIRALSREMTFNESGNRIRFILAADPRIPGSGG